MKNKPVRLFVDEIDGHTARLLLGETAFELPTTLLPTGAREGSWVTVSMRVASAPPDNATALRRKLGKADPGGDIKL